MGLGLVTLERRSMRVYCEATNTEGRARRLSHFPMLPLEKCRIIFCEEIMD